VRVEQALRLVPGLEVLAPLRALLLSVSRADEQTRWASAGRYLTVSKHAVEAEELRDRLEGMLQQVTGHLRELYHHAVGAIDAQGRGDTAAAIVALRGAGDLEARVGRFKPAEVWYDSALELAISLSDRGPELELLRVLGALCRDLGRYHEAARHCQRSLALAEAEFNRAAVVAACEELGNVHRAMGEMVGARAWYERGLGSNGIAGGRGGWLLLGLGDLARSRGDLVTAAELLDRARTHMEEAVDAAGTAQTLSAQAQMHIARGNLTAAFAAYREALAWARRSPEPANLEVDIRMRLADLASDSGRWLEAEADLRHAEQAALAHGLPHRLVEIYTLLGRLSGRVGEETGFVFFEQALELCRALELDGHQVADVCVDYGQFHGTFGNLDASRAYLERAAETYRESGQAMGVERVQAEMSRLGLS
jgi:tetratricopeptide (TPR) repeat protein